MQFRLLYILCIMFVMVFSQRGTISSQSNANVLSLDWSPDGMQIATGSVTGDVQIWDAASGALVKTLRGHTQEIMTVAWSPEGASIASGSPDGSVRIWDATRGELRQTIQFAAPDGILRAVMQIEWSPDGKYIAGACETGQIIIWDALTGQEYASYAHDMWAFTVSWHPSDDVLASGGMDGRVLLWNTVTQRLSEFPMISTEVIQSIDSINWSPDGQRIAIAGGLLKREMWAQIFDFSAQSLLFEIPLSPESFAGLRWSPDGSLLAIGNNINIIHIVDSSTGLVVESIDGTGTIQLMSWSPYGGRLALRGTAYQTRPNFINSVQIIVPAPSLDRLNAIAELCVRDAATQSRAVTGLASQRVDSLDALPDFVAQVESLPEGAIPAACRADLLAVAEALR